MTEVKTRVLGGHCKRGHLLSEENTALEQGGRYIKCKTCATDLSQARRRGEHVHKPTLEERFWKRVIVKSKDECWLWTGPIDHKGYGSLGIGKKRVRTHRIAWELHHGKSFPEGLFACHSCDVPACANPHHIWPGTRVDNAQDAAKKGRLFSPLTLTHCKRGHEFNAENTRYYENGLRRVCQLCRVLLARMKREKVSA